MKYNEWHLGLIAKVYGDEGVALAKKVHAEISDFNRVGIPTEPGDGPVTLEHTEAGMDNGFTVIHEFTHYYCAMRHRVLADFAHHETGDVREEACALFAEYLLASISGPTGLAQWAGTRFHLWKPFPAAVIHNMLSDPDHRSQSVDELLIRMLQGQYG